MTTRRQFLGLIGAGLYASQVAASVPESARRRLAVVTTTWWERSHAWHMAERFLHGYPRDGVWHRPPIDVVSAYVDQVGDNDLSHSRADEFGFSIYPTIAEAVRCGTSKLAVDAVLVIGEHGDYPRNEYGQKKYPRYEFFREVTDVFRQDGRSVPMFNDKHLSWNPEWAQKMVDVSQELNFGFAAGSSLPVTWRMPAVDMPYGAQVTEMLCVSTGPIDHYDFHALEVIQCMAERRNGGETGVRTVQALRGEAVWKAMSSESWSTGGWDPELFSACLCRSQTLAQLPTFSHRYPTVEQIQQWVKDPIAYRIEYRDGTRAALLMLNGLVQDFTFAARIVGQPQPLSTLFYLPATPNVNYSAMLMAQAERTFLTGKSPAPIQRTLLTTGLVEAGVRSLATGQKRVATPHLAIEYAVSQESQFART